jgi:hypothetical protein
VMSENTETAVKHSSMLLRIRTGYVCLRDKLSTFLDAAVFSASDISRKPVFLCAAVFTIAHAYLLS